MDLVITLSIDIQHNSKECHYSECRYAECRNYSNVMLSIVMPNVITLSVVVTYHVGSGSVVGGWWLRLPVPVPALGLEEVGHKFSRVFERAAVVAAKLFPAIGAVS